MTGHLLRDYSTAAYALLLIVVVYVALGVHFAVTTPAWQNPDEPAHYNYIAHIATERRFPVLQMGDYDEAYLQRLKAEKFPQALSIEPVRYESHQPPLYYLIAVPFYWLGQGHLLALRLLGVALGAGVVLLIYQCAQTVAPRSPHIALGAAAFAAFLPMHSALMASVNNDALADLVIAATVLILLRWQQRAATGESKEGYGALLAAGVLIGLGFLTKATTYILLPVAVAVVALNALRPDGAAGTGLRKQAGRVGLLAAPALLLGLPWWIRNSLLYGNLDVLGLRWHDEVVTGQPTAAGWIAENGWWAYWERAWTFTSKSFWGVFGWLGVFMDARIYTFLLILSAMAALGIMFAFWRRTAGGGIAWRDFISSPWMTLILLWSAAFAAYGWYNLGFIQHQGRYLFPALPAWSLFFALGWWAALGRRASLFAGGILLVSSSAYLLIMTVSGGEADRWTLLLLGAAGVGLLLYGLVSARVERIFGRRRSVSADSRGFRSTSGLRNASVLHMILYAGLFLVLAAIDIAIPFLYIVPQLGS